MVMRDDALNGLHWDVYAYDAVSGRLASVLDVWTGEVNSFVWNPEGTLRCRVSSACSDFDWVNCPQRYLYDEEGRLLMVERWYSGRGEGWYLTEQYQYNGDGVRVWSNEWGTEYQYVCGIGCNQRANRVYSRYDNRWQLYEERLSTPTVFLYGAHEVGGGWWLNAVHSLLSGYMLSALTPPYEWILVATDRHRVKVHSDIRVAKVKREPKHWSESWMLICTRPLTGLPEGVDAIAGPRLRHWLIAACGQIFEVPSGSTPKLNPDHPKSPGEHLLPDCDIVPVSPFEKRCICSYAKYLQENWEYNPVFSNCQAFVMDVLRSCMVRPPKPIIVDGDLDWLYYDSSICRWRITY